MNREPPSVDSASANESGGGNKSEVTLLGLTSTERAAEINRLAYFPLLSLPGELISRILACISRDERRSLLLHPTLDKLHGEKLEFGFKIETSPDGCKLSVRTRYESPIHSSIEGIMGRMDQWKGRVKQCTVELRFKQSNPLNIEILKHPEVWKLDGIILVCSYKRGERHSEMAALFNDDFINERIKQTHPYFSLHVVCPVNAKCLYNHFMDSTLKDVFLRLFVARQTALDLLALFGISVERRMFPGRSKKYKGVVTVTRKMKYYSEREKGNMVVRSSLKVCYDRGMRKGSLTGDDVRVEYHVYEQDEEMDSYYDSDYNDEDDSDEGSNDFWDSD